MESGYSEQDSPRYRIDFSPYHFPAHTATIARRRRASFRCSISIGGCTLVVYGSVFSDSRAYYRSSYRRLHAQARNEPKNVRFRLRPHVFGFSVILRVIARLSARCAFFKNRRETVVFGEIARESRAPKIDPKASRATKSVRAERITDEAENHVILSKITRKITRMKTNSA